MYGRIAGGSIPISPFDEKPPSGGLALRAKIHVVSPDSLPPDRCPTAGTRLAMSVPDAQMVPDLDMNRLRRFTDGARAPGHDLANGTVELFHVVVGQVGHDRLRMDPRFKEDLIRVSVPDAAENGVVVNHHTRLFPPVLCDQFPEEVKGEPGPEDIHPLACVSGNQAEIASRHKIHLGHLLVVAQGEDFPVSEDKYHTEMSGELLFVALKVKPAGKHQVDHEIDVRLEGEPEKRTVDLDGLHGVVAQELIGRGRQSVAQDDRLAHSDPGNAGPDQGPLEGVTDIEEVRQFRHKRIVSCTGNIRKSSHNCTMITLRGFGKERGSFYIDDVSVRGVLERQYRD
jgi:hypothetical protein